MFLILSLFIPLFNFILAIFFGEYLGRTGIKICLIFNLIINTVITCIVFISMTATTYHVIFGLWIMSENIIIPWDFHFDNLTKTMWLIVNIISFLVHLYSFEYMSSDASLIRFLSYLALFTFFMLILISGNNLIILFLGWEGVGLSSYLLISFWFTRIAANKAAIKALVVNRVSDFALTIGILLLLLLCQTLQFPSLYLLIPFFQQKNIWFGFYLMDPLFLICFLLFIGAMGKSAQIILHTWLPDAMEGPTPVSALIHAATMVTAGVFLVIKCSILFECVPIFLVIITIVGATTAFFAASIGLAQNDIKKVIAYSTCSQLGYMFFICGLSGYNIAFFHLVNHAFFKALLFLTAGAIIHSMANEQDMRKYGGLFQLLPFTYVMLIIGSNALMGIPFLTGYYSKDCIIEYAISTYTITGTFAYSIGLFTAGFTAYYSFRVLILTFLFDINSNKHVIQKTHEATPLMTFVLIFLSIGSIFFGYLFKDKFIGFGNLFYTSNITILNYSNTWIEAEALHPFLKLQPLIFSLLFVIACLWFQKGIIFSQKIYTFLTNRWFFDLIYNKFINEFILLKAYNNLFILLDKGILELIGPQGFHLFLNNISLFCLKTQRGLIFYYGRIIFCILYFIILIWIIF